MIMIRSIPHYNNEEILEKAYFTKGLSKLFLTNFFAQSAHFSSIKNNFPPFICDNTAAILKFAEIFPKKEIAIYEFTQILAQTKSHSTTKTATIFVLELPTIWSGTHRTKSQKMTLCQSDKTRGKKKEKGYISNLAQESTKKKRKDPINTQPSLQATQAFDFLESIWRIQ
ncbi:hypothetical protein RFI_18671 [Reticulomyxa filosa]|uniref:Uncharacterized protein n=1 Tax=Reticulomyxa filosa TaxID=46433 RepID=X6MZU7_RETFI|nr:hypothetical protein RFI_18671 [Reticulomyxa filosa]|eukprot:ETO18592.1 hypothetical protein RFI_18671 [Reticulomyxa filosa]